MKSIIRELDINMHIFLFNIGHFMYLRDSLLRLIDDKTLNHTWEDE